MSGPVSSMPPSDSPWVPLWPYAVALHTSAKRLQTDLMANAIPVYVVGGEAQVKRRDIEDFLAARQREAEVRAEMQLQASSTKKASGSSSIQDRLNRQAAELEKLQRQLNELLPVLVKRNMGLGAANEA